MAHETLIETGALAARLGDPEIAIVDCRFSLDDETWGEREYLAHHIPGAVYAHLGRDLSAPPTGRNGRHPLPDPGALADTVGRLGIANGMQVVAYDQDNGMYASRFWWLVKWLGHDEVAVLDGGFAKWMAEGRATESGAAPAIGRQFRGQPRARMAVNVDEVGTLVGRGGWRLIDARAPERFRGDVESIDRVAGHIPGAVNHPYKSNLTEAGTFKGAGELRDQFTATLGGVAPERAVFYCGSGVTACQNLLALEHAGLRGARLYAGSWSEWSADPARPVEKGAAS